MSGVDFRNVTTIPIQEAVGRGQSNAGHGGYTRDATNRSGRGSHQRRSRSENSAAKHCPVSTV
eukprot:5736638-Pyramimonas_sp.AAC.1